MDLLTGKVISRRKLVRGLGASIALPFLDAMVPAGVFSQTHARAAEKKPAHRFLAYYTPNGQAMPHWTPNGRGRDFELSEILEPLAPFKDQLIAFTGLQGSWESPHYGSSTCFLSGLPGDEAPTASSGIRALPSIDQLMAREFERETQLGSLQLGLDGAPMAGSCAVLNCIYTDTISWRTSTQPLPMENRPRVVFETLFGDAGSTDRAARERRLSQQESILDSVMEQLRDLRRELGPQDNLRVDEYTDAVRDVERRIRMAEAQLDIDLPAMTEPAGIPDALEDHLGLQLDMQLLAFQADLTRVSTFMVSREVNARTYPQIGINEAWHPLSHHNDQPAVVAHMAKLNRYHVELFSKYLTKLSETPDGDGSLLDHMTILYGSGMSNSMHHSSDNLPVLVLGGGCGRLLGGRHLVYENKPSHANLLVSLMDTVGIPVDKVGESTGAFPLDTLADL